MSGRRKRGAGVQSRVVGIRFREAEWAALQQFAAGVGQPASRVLRRLAREAASGRPDYFKDELVDLRGAVRELAKIGGNLNQLARAANQGAGVRGADVRRVVNACTVQTAAVKELYRAAVRTTVKRAVVAAEEEAE